MSTVDKKINVEDQSKVIKIGWSFEYKHPPEKPLEGHTNFVQLHNHSEYSLLDGMSRIERGVLSLDFDQLYEGQGTLVREALANKQPGVGLSDHGTLGGFFRFHTECVSNGINPIIGIEWYLVKDIAKTIQNKDKSYNHVTMFAKNYEGLQNLFRANQIAWTKGFYFKPKIDLKTLIKYRKSTILTTGCDGDSPFLHIIKKEGLSSKEKLAKCLELAKMLQGYWEDDLYIEVFCHNYADAALMNKYMFEVADRLRIKPIATNDVHYVRERDKEAHECMLCIQVNHSMNDPDHWTFGGGELFMKSRAQMEESFRKFHSYVPKHIVKASLDNTMEINSKVYIDMPSGHKKIVPAPILRKPTIEEHYKWLITDGWKKKKVKERAAIYAKKYHTTEEEALMTYRKRLDYEMSVIKELGFMEYLLIVHELISFAKNSGIVMGPGRGSAAASLVCYLLGITNVDPLIYDLMFERFISKYKMSLPDIDLDFDWHRRAEIFDWCVERFGIDKFAHIGTYGILKGKQVIKDVGRAFRVPIDEVNAITKHVIHRSGGDERKSMTVLDSFESFSAMREFDAKYPQVKKYAVALESTIRNAGVHACGVVISDSPLTDVVPIETRGQKSSRSRERVVVSAVTGKENEKLGLLKLDILGLKTLSILYKAVNLIKKGKGDVVVLDDIDLEDKAVLQEFTNINVTGIFQFDSVGMKNTLEGFTFREFEDVICWVALYRPGTMRCISSNTLVYTHRIHNNTLQKAKDLYKYVKRYQHQQKLLANHKHTLYTSKATGLTYITFNEPINMKLRVLLEQPKAMSLNIKTGKYEKCAILNAYKGTVRKCYRPIVRNYTANHIKLGSYSLDHEFLTLDKYNNISYKKLRHLRNSDYIAIRYYNNNYKIKSNKYGTNDYQSTAMLNYRYECAICGCDDISLDISHINGRRIEDLNCMSNLVYLCPNDHRRLHQGKISMKDVLSARKSKMLPNNRTNDYKFVKFLGLEYVGEEETYDFTVDKYHNYTAGGFITHNSGITSQFRDRRVGKEKTPSVHKIYDDITKKTHGCIVYQEQVSEVFAKMAGFALADADSIRIAISKAYGKDIIDGHRKGFMAGCKKVGVDKKKAEKLFNQIIFFGCVTGDTVVYKGTRGSGKDRKITVKELYDKQFHKWARYQHSVKYLLAMDEQDRRIGINNIEQIVKTGVKKVYKITTESGKYATSSMDQGYYKDGHWRALSELSVGDGILITNFKKSQYDHVSIDYNNGGEEVDEETKKKSMEVRRWLVRIKARCSICYRVVDHLILYYKDGNSKNNDDDNLLVCCKKCRVGLHNEHVMYSNCKYLTEYEKITSIKYVGEEETYDIIMKDPMNNYIINDGIVTHNSYSFNKAHAAAYGTISYWSMWLKHYYPLEFMAASLSEEKDDKRIMDFVREARRLGLTVNTPDINYSQDRYSIGRNNEIVGGLGDIKGVGIKACEAIMAEQPFDNFSDMLNRVNRRVVNKRVMKFLAQAGAFKSWCSNTKELIAHMDDIARLKDRPDMIDSLLRSCEELPGWGKEEDVNNTRAVLSMPSLEHPFNFYKSFLRKHLPSEVKKRFKRMDQLEKDADHIFQVVYVAGQIIDMKYNQIGDFDKVKPDDKELAARELRFAPQGARYVNFDLEDDTGFQRVHLKPVSYEKCKDIFEKGLGAMLLIRGKYFGHMGGLFQADEVVDLEELRKRNGEIANDNEKMMLNHPLWNINWSKAKTKGIVSITECIAKNLKKATIIGIPTYFKFSYTKRGDMMFMGSFDDGIDAVECLGWSDVAEPNKKLLSKCYVDKLPLILSIEMLPQQGSDPYDKYLVKKIHGVYNAKKKE